MAKVNVNTTENMNEENKAATGAQGTDEWTEQREVYIPYRRGDEKTWHGSINNRSFSVPKGQKVMVPLPLYYVIRQQLENQEKMEAEAERDISYHDRGVIR